VQSNHWPQRVCGGGGLNSRLKRAVGSNKDLSATLKGCIVVLVKVRPTSRLLATRSTYVQWNMVAGAEVMEKKRRGVV
jgi:hypothetical protein